MTELNMMSKKLWLPLFIFLLAITGVFAQEIRVQGTVRDAQGQPLPGATIIERGANNGTQSDFDGNFALQVQDGSAVLLFSYIGFSKKKIELNGRTQINVSLEEDATGLDEVVLIGYGGVKRSDLTGSVASVTSKDLQRTVNQSFQEALEGRAAGVQILSGEGTPGGDVTIRIRGGTSISASNDPLYVIDGFPIIVDASETNSALGQIASGASSNPLSGIDPNDIESIEVLKDASASAIYGSRGANGVIIITTKSGTSGKSKVTFNTFYSTQEITDRIPLLNAEQYAEYRLLSSDPDNPTPTDDILTGFLDGSIELETFDRQDQILKTSSVKSYNLGLSGGSKEFRYNVSAGAFMNDGVIKNSSFDRYNVRGKFNGQMSEKLSYDALFSLSHTIQQGVPTGGGNQTQSGILINANLFPPLRLPDEDEGDGLTTIGGINDRSPLTILNGTEIENKQDLTQANLSLDYKITDDLTFKVLGGLNIRSSRNARYNSSNTPAGFVSNGNGEISQRTIRTWLNENILTFNKEFGVHNLTVLGGFTMQGADIEFFSARNTSFDLESLGFNDISLGSNPSIPQSSKEKWGIASFLSRVNYSFDDRFLFTASIRADGSSRFADGNKWGYFPSAAFAWKLNNENFLANSSVVDNLKLRIGYGETGNQEVPRYRSISELSINFTNFGTDNGALFPASGISRVANPDLSWETTTQTNAGIDFGLFKGRISGSVDYYIKKTKDMLLSVNLNPTTGIGQPALRNIGNLENEGVEIALNTVNVETDNFRWTSSFNISTNRNEITSLGDTDQILFDVRGGWHQIINEVALIPGESLGTFWGFETAGILGQDANGDPLPLPGLDGNGDPILTEVGYVNEVGPGGNIYVDQLTVDTDGDGAPDQRDGIINGDDRVAIGKGVPDFFGGFTNNFEYKGFSLNVFFDFQYGHDIYNSERVYYEELHTASNRSTAWLNRWTPENQNTTIPAFERGDNQRFLDKFVEDASFIRLKNVTIAYDFNSKQLKKSPFSALKLYVSGQNLWIDSDYSGLNPQASTIRNPIAPGVDWGSYPIAKIFTLGLNATF
ncbi:TonB-dependent receptor [Flagellimonas sp. CMM7]|uniref:SusC/RagA family TonB-linked outer membrane protein n=1 Tax=Flagellimonas sp. CMM7 TaxID=2654676 RepID=UPI0013D58EE8|nr:TonB-dependent receptor [Flagellimonas sp. CMM7]UII78732.1 TonB-dependent receptor [Flagellimonas sp. CMM7]